MQTPSTLNIVRHSYEDTGKNIQEISAEFLEHSAICGNVVAVYEIVPNKGVSLYITEYADGKFWTFAERDDVLGTFTQCIEHLVKYFL